MEWYLLAGVLLLLGLGTIAYVRARRELMTQARVSWTTFWFAWIAFTGCGALTFLAAYMQAWPLAMSRTISWWFGGVVAIAGGAMHVAARMRFTFRRAWGLDVDKLYKSGIYRWTRNPQIVGWFLIYVGVAIMGQSMAALLLAILFSLACHPWILLEERVLKRQFGEQFDEYCKRTRRYL